MTAFSATFGSVLDLRVGMTLRRVLAAYNNLDSRILAYLVRMPKPRSPFLFTTNKRHPVIAAST
jgi:hypothetical protein